jgi:cysteinyl-tRNA synthetase
MTLKLYNTLNRREESFEPLEPGKVRMYYCGVTVYDYCHLGHARACIIWDVVRRYLQWRGYEVRFVQNFTDIDDKILNRAKAEGSSMEEVAEKYIQAYFEDMGRLKIKEADEYPRATHSLDGIKRLIHDLETKGYAYPAEGDVYYAVRRFSDYGKLSGRKLDEMQAGASGRVEVEGTEDSKKRDPFDFALWKGAKPGEPAWESAWGQGRPGWHIECSAMVRDRLGETIDIHAGGADLIFPHHENEIAQSEAVTEKPLARYWLHNGMVTVNGEKMSKSLGNFITIRELLDRSVDPMAVRLFVLMAQYRKPIDFTDEAIAAAQNGWNTLKEGLLFGNLFGAQLGWTEVDTAEVSEVEREEEIPEASASPVETQPASPTEVGTWRQTLTQLLIPFLKLPRVLGEFSQQYKGLVVLTIMSAIALAALKGTLEVFKVSHSVPLLPTVLEVVGIVVAGRYLLRPHVRKTLIKQVLLLAEPSPQRATLETLQLKPANQITDQILPTISTQSPESFDASSYIERFQTAVDDDFNFSGGLAVLFELAKELRKEGNLLVHQGKTETPAPVLKQQWQTLVSLAQVLGLEAQPEAETETETDQEGLSDVEISALIQQRQEARNTKNFAESDRIRNELQAQGITLIDTPEGTRWHRG